MMDAATYVAQLPTELQEQIRAELTAALAAGDNAAEDDINRAMNSRIGDLEELLDVRKYTGGSETPALIPGYQAPAM